VDDRRVISGILHVLKVGCRWQDTPTAYGPHTTIYNRYNRWSQRGIWQRLFEKISAVGPVPTELMLDSSHVKAHRSAAGGKGGRGPRAIGRSRGGSTSKIHCLADGCGRPIALALTPGNVADISMALPLLQAVLSPKRLIADKAYDAQSLRDWLKSKRIIATIPSTASRSVPFPISRKAYRRRNRIERFFCHLKNWRRVATRYDPLACNYLAAVALAGLRDRVDLNESPT
jgi:transposase